MNILLIVSWYKTNQYPMVGSFFEEQARGLMKKGHKVSILYPEFLPFSSKQKVISNKYIDEDIATYHFVYKSKIPRSKRINYLLFQKKAFNYYKKEILKDFTPHIIHAHTVFYGGIIANYINKKTKTPYIITEHFTKFITGEITSKTDLKQAIKVYNCAKKNIIVSTGFKKLLLENLEIKQNNFIVIPNMVSNIFFTNNSKHSIKKETPIFFTMSFLTERKNHKLIFDSFRLFLKKVPNAILKIGGDGTIANDLKNYCKQINISKNVTFLGELTREQVKNEINEMDIFLLASKFETFGVVLIEALANGKPVVSTDSVGPRDIITDFNGKLSKSFEKDDFLEALEDVYNSYDNYDRKKIAKDCYEKFSEETIINRLISEYR